MTLNSGTSSTQRLISADFFTPGFRISGKTIVPSSGLMGLMNDPITSFMEVLDARLARLHMPTKLIEHYQVLRLVRSQIFAVALARREDLGPQALARGGYQKINEYGIHLASPVYELTGTLEWAGRFDFSAVMVEGKRDFVPLYNGQLTAILISALKVDAPTFLFNRKQVDLLGLKSQRAEN